jgi:metallophosphoesterase (TIGR03767 family)
VDRRTFLARSAALSAGAWATTLWVPALASAQGRGHVANPGGTTLERTLVPAGSPNGYRQLTQAPGWPIMVREELAQARQGRHGRREALATIVHLSDIHIIDAQSPTRVEFTDRLEDPATVNPAFFSSAWRPQETLSGHIADAMAQAIRRVGAGPVTGRPYDCAVSTGDNTDNMQSNELDWFLAVLDGGRPMQVNSGDPERYEGVQDDDPLSFDPAYWHPNDNPRTDSYKRDLGYPTRHGLLDAAITAFTPVGLPCPWYSVYGNHDGLIQGNSPPVWDAIATGPLKVVGLPDGLSVGALERILQEQDVGRLLTAPHAPARLVTPDPERRAVLAGEWVARHRQDRGGPGPVGHGMSEEAIATGHLHYTFDIAPEVLGIAIDTVNRSGYASGSIDRAQFAWVEQQLVSASSRYFDRQGNEVRTGNADRLVLLFAHHTLISLDNPLPDPLRNELDPVRGPEFEALLHRFPNVVAFVGGHTHRNEILLRTPPGSLDSGGFYEVVTAAHIDFPQHARIIELVDNRDGTLSLFTTLIDHAGPVLPPDEAATTLELASVARELAMNDVQKSHGGVGQDKDRNTELLLTAPFQRRPGGGPPPRQNAKPQASAAAQVVAAADGPVLPATGGPGLVAAGGAALLGAAVALRGRGQRSGGPDAS